MLTDKSAVITVRAGDEEKDLAGILHTVQPGLHRVGAGLEIPARVPLHAGEIRPSILCTDLKKKNIYYISIYIYRSEMLIIE